MSAVMNPSQQQAQRPRAGTQLSFRSNRSKDNDLSPTKSKQSKHERNISDSERRKSHYDPGSKANPNQAMNEAQPIAAALEKPTLQSLRSFQHKDLAGNDIVDPDLSNPTRSRWERPLETIKSFEAAIDGEYRRRAQTMRADQTDMMSGHNSRRSSYYGGGPDQNRYSRASYYGNQGNHDSYDQGSGMGGPVGGSSQRMRYGNRMQSDSGWNNRQSQYMNNGTATPNGVYPIHGLQQSRDTVNTNGSNGSHSDGPYSNDPSNSDNSSFERGTPVRRAAPPPQQDMGEQYGFNGFGGEPGLNTYGNGQGNGYFPSPQMNNGPPAPPKHQHITPPAPIKLNNSGGAPPVEAGTPNVPPKNGGDDKRRSWFKKRFSKD